MASEVQPLAHVDAVGWRDLSALVAVVEHLRRGDGMSSGALRAALGTCGRNGLPGRVHRAS